MDILKLAGASLFAFGIASAPVMAQDSPSKWDKDGSGVVDQTEWSENFDTLGLFDSWDADGDGTMTRDEFNQGVYSRYDRDQSGDFSEEEMGFWERDMGESVLFHL